MNFLVSVDDINLIKEKRYFRLMGLFNVNVTQISKDKVYGRFHSELLKEARKRRAILIQWILAEKGIFGYIIKPDGSFVEGVFEPEIKRAKVGDIVQLERVGFAKVESTNVPFIVYFAHQ